MKKALIIAVLFVVALSIYPNATQAAITLVAGGALSAAANNGNDVTITFPGGVLENDVVIMFGGHAFRSGSAIGPSTGGYTTEIDHNSEVPALGVWYKVMGATPDGDVVGQGTGNNADVTAYGIFILRGVDTASIFDQTTTTAGPTVTANPNPPAIDTQTAGAWVIPIGAKEVFDNSIVAPSGYLNLVYNSKNDSNDYSTGGATLEIATPTTEDPPIFTSWAVTIAWYTVTLAIKPSIASAPIIVTRFPSNFGATYATFNGESTDGDLDEHGFAFSTDATLATGVSTSTLGSFSGTPFSEATTTSISADTKYFVRAYGTNAGGTAYGRILYFTSGNNIVTRKMRLFQGFTIKIFPGGKIKLYRR